MGAKYLPFTVGVKSRNYDGYGEEKVVDARSPDPPQNLEGEVVNDRQINLKIRGPKNNYGALVTKFMVRWKSKRRMGKQVQQLLPTGQETAWESIHEEVYSNGGNMNIIDHPRVENGWERANFISSCGMFYNVHGGFNILGNEAVLYKTKFVGEHSALRFNVS